MPVLKSALTAALIAAALLAVAASTADAQRYGSQTNQWSQYSGAPFSREANERFTP